MGLDINLYRCINKKEYEIKEKLADEICQNTIQNYFKKTGVEKYNMLNEEQKVAVDEELKKEYSKIGVDENGIPFEPSMKPDVKASELYPKHTFERGYFRSSYNIHGFNHVLPQYLGEEINLYSIFDKNTDEFYFTPDWNKSLNNVNEAIKKFNSKRGEKFHIVDEVLIRKDLNVSSTLEAIEIFKKKKNTSNFYCSEGNFYLNKPLTVKALIPGKSFFSSCVYVVYEESEENINFFMQALEIVKETIEYVLSTGNPEYYHLSWSS